MTNNYDFGSTPPTVLVAVERLTLTIIGSVTGFNNVLKAFVIDGLSSSLKEIQDNINLAYRARKDGQKRIECIEDAVMCLYTLKSYLRVAIEYGRRYKSGGLPYTAAADLTIQIMDVEKQLNSWKAGTEKYFGIGSAGSDAPLP